MQIKVYIKKYIALCLFLVLFGAGLLVQYICFSIGDNIIDQNIAKSYGQDKEYTQLTVFTSNVSGFGKNNIPELRNGIKRAIDESVFSEDIAGRSFIDSYCAIDKLDISSHKGIASMQVYAVSGDFFVFHPMALSSGSYFSDENDSNGDGIVLNELAAWQLFGATDIAGMQVNIGDVSMPVRGVVTDNETKLTEASGENIPRVYLSYDKYIQVVNSSNEGLSVASPIGCYEALIVNPVKDFAINTVTTIFATNIKLTDDTYEYVVNSERFSFINRVILIKNFFNRVMNKTGVVYPYWENYARAKEQVIMLLTILEILLFLGSLVFFIIGILNLKSEYLKIKKFVSDRKEDLSEYIKAKTRKKIIKAEEKN